MLDVIQLWVSIFSYLALDELVVGQNVDRQNIEQTKCRTDKLSNRQNVDRPNVEQTKCRQRKCRTEKLVKKKRMAKGLNVEI